MRARWLIVAALCGSCCGGTQATVHTAGRDDDSPSSVGPEFAVLSADPAPIVFTRSAVGGKDVRYVFRREAVPTDRALHAVAIDRALAYAVGDGGVALRRTGAAGWQLEPTGTDAALRGVAVATWEGHDYAWMPSDPRSVPIYAAGDRGTIVHRDAAGKWTVQPSGTDADLHAIGATAAEAIAVGDRGTILWLRDGVWRVVASHTTAALRAIATAPSVIIVGDGGTIVSCGVKDGAPTCDAHQAATTADLRIVSERTIRWDAGTIRGFTMHDLEVFAADGTRMSRVAWAPIEFAGAAVSSFAPRSYHAQHWSFDVCDPEDVAVGAGGAIALVDPYKAALAVQKDAPNPEGQADPRARDAAEPGAFDVQTLPEAVDLDGVVFEGLDGFVVGDRGTILQLTVEGARIPLATLL